MNTTFALDPDIRTSLGVLAGLTDSRRNSATYDEDKAQDRTVKNEESHWFGNVGFSLAVLTVVGLGALWGWAIVHLMTLMVETPSIISNLERALSR